MTQTFLFTLADQNQKTWTIKITRTHLAAIRTASPSGLSIYILLCFSKSHSPSHLLITHSASFLTLCHPSLYIPAVAKAMVFCGGSWLGLICQSADLPSLLFSLSSRFLLGPSYQKQSFSHTLFSTTESLFCWFVLIDRCIDRMNQTLMIIMWRWAWILAVTELTLPRRKADFLTK